MELNLHLVHSNEMLSSIILNQFNDLWNNQENRILEVSKSINN